MLNGDGMGLSIRKRFRHCGKYGVSSSFAQVAYFPYTKTKRIKGRQRKYQTTTPRQRSLNNKRAVRYLEALVHSNFGEGDFLLSLSYSAEHQPKDEKEAKRLFGNFIGRINYRLKKQDLPNAKWVSVIEKGKNGRIHHHVIISCGLDRDTIEKVWGHGYANTRRLQPDSQKGLLPLVHYIAKEFKDDDKPKNTRKWDCSQNLVKPWDAVNDEPRMMSRKKFRLMQDMPENAEAMKKIIEGDNPNYELISVEKEYREDIGEWYFFCRMRLSTKKSTDNSKTVDKKSRNKQEDNKCQKTPKTGNARAKPPPGSTGLP